MIIIINGTTRNNSTRFPSPFVHARKSSANAESRKPCDVYSHVTRWFTSEFSCSIALLVNLQAISSGVLPSSHGSGYLGSHCVCGCISFPGVWGGKFTGTPFCGNRCEPQASTAEAFILAESLTLRVTFNRATGGHTKAVEVAVRLTAADHCPVSIGSDVCRTRVRIRPSNGECRAAAV